MPGVGGAVTPRRVGHSIGSVAICLIGAAASASCSADHSSSETSVLDRSAPSTAPSPVRVERRGHTPVSVGEPIDVTELRGRILFDDYEDLYTMRPDGTDLVRLSSRAGAEFDGAWSPDGQFVVYRDSRRGINDDDEIYIVRADGTGVENLTDDPANDWGPDWSSDGQWIVFNSDRGGGTFSPDGSRIAFMSHVGSDYDIFVADLATGETSRLTDAGGSDGWPSWSPDGTTIAFATERDDCLRVPDDQDCWHDDEPGEHHDIWLMDANGQNQRRVTPESGQFVTWSPDGRHLLISGRTLFVVRPDGTGRLELRADGLPLALGGIPDWTG